MTRGLFTFTSIAVLTITVFTQGQTQNFPATMDFPVIFYDYQADGSNPAFNQRYCQGGLRFGMVDEKLGPNRKPVVNPAGVAEYDPRCYESVGQWFWPSGANGPDPTAEFYFDDTDSTWRYRNLTQYQGRTGEFVAQNYQANYDLSNIVIYDSLQFDHVGAGTYVFEKTGENPFFGVDGRGYGNETPGVTSGDGQEHNFGFTMELHHDFQYRPGLVFDFCGDDDVWVFINDSLVIDLGGVHTRKCDRIELDDLAGVLQEGETYRFDFFYCERRVKQSNIQIETNILTESVAGLQIHAPDTNLVAGNTTSMQAILTTNNGDTLEPTDEAYQEIQWELLGSTKKPGDSLYATTGRTTSFYGEQAHRCADIRAIYEDPKSGESVEDIATICIVPGPPHRITAEQDDSPDLWEPNDRNSVSIPNNANFSTDTIYAFIRDRFDNLVSANSGRAVQSNWTVEHPAIAGINPLGDNWIAYVNREIDSTRQTNVYVSKDNLIPDTVTVSILGADITRIRVVDGDGNVVTNLTMTTDDNIGLEVQGLPSTANQTNPSEADWVPFNGQFALNSSDITVAVPPSSGPTGSWTFRPTHPGSGTITVDNDGVDQYSIPVTVNTAAPSTVELRLVEDQTPRAGEPFLVVAEIYGQSGAPTPGTYCFQDNNKSRYFDVVGAGTGKPDPSVETSNTDGSNLDTGTLGLRENASSPDGDSVAQCFQSGVDTFEVTLYNAADGVEHQVWVRLNGKGGIVKEASTSRFMLQPGAVDSVALEYVGGGALPDSLNWTAPDSSFYASVIGYDQWGNRIGTVDGVWETSGNLHELDEDTAKTQFYSTDDVRLTENGCITVTAQDNPSATDEVCIVITPPDAFVDSAFTRDTDGDGLLDRIEVHFSRPAQFPENYDVGNIEVSHSLRVGGDIQPIDFTVTSMTGANGLPIDSVYYIDLQEEATSMGQTGWEPTLSFANAPDVSADKRPTIDGAGPVIWKVTKETKDINDPSKDVVSVQFSENLDEVPGASDKPGEVFYVWIRQDTVINGVDTAYFVVQSTFLEGIDYFKNPSRQNVAEFLMLNENQITSSHYFSIVADGQTPVLEDRNQVPPSVNNQKVKVIIKKSPLDVIVGPNPSTPNPSYRNPDALEYEKPDVSARRAYDSNSGTAFSIKITLPSDENMTIEGALRIYDNVGNLVHSRFSDGNLVPASWKDDWEAGTSKGIGFYWNGYNDREMPVSPGNYRALVTLTVTSTVDGSSNTEQIRRVLPLGIRR